MEAIFDLSKSLNQLYEALNKELSQDWKNYTITINDETFDLSSESEPEVRSVVIKQLLKDALVVLIDHKGEEDYEGNPFEVIIRILSGARKEDHQFEIVKEEIVTNLDEDGNPITAKPLNEDNVLVQWQDENRFKFESSEEEHEKFVELLREKRPDCKYLKKHDAYIEMDDKTKQMNDKIMERGQDLLNKYEESV